MSTWRRECVGTHFACGCFKQWGRGFLGPKKIRHNRRKIKSQSGKSNGRTTEFMGSSYLFEPEWHNRQNKNS
jgi:hypothetical protein